MTTKKKIISVDTLEKDNKKKTNKKPASNLDLDKVKDFVSDNKDTIGKIASIVGGLFGTSKKTTKTSKTKGRSSKTTKASKKESGLFDVFGSLFKK